MTGQAWQAVLNGLGALAAIGMIVALTMALIESISRLRICYPHRKAAALGWAVCAVFNAGFLVLMLVL